MSNPKIIQILSHNGKVLALSDEGKIYSHLEIQDFNVWSDYLPSLKESEENWKYINGK
jgi:hypothetical protein